MNENMRLQDLIEALTRQLDQSMPTAMTNVSGFVRNNTTGEIRFIGGSSGEEVEDLKREIEVIREDFRGAEAREENERDRADCLTDKLRKVEFEREELREKLEWAETEVNRLKLERKALLTP